MANIIATVVTNLDEWHRIYRQILKATTPQGGQLQSIVAEETITDIKRRFTTQTSPTLIPWPQTKKGGPALMKTRRLYNSFYPIIHGPEVMVTSMDERAGSHNYGAFIQPKDSTYLAIPATEEIANFKGRRSWREAFPGAFVRRSNRDGRIKLNLFQRLGSSKTLERLAALVPFVRIPQREFMGVSAMAWAQILQRARTGAIGAWK